MYKQRLRKIHKWLSNQEASCFLISSPKNIYYYTGFKGLSPQEREAFLLIASDFKSFLVVPRLYEETANKVESIKNKSIELEVLNKKESFFDFLGKKLKSCGIIIEENNLTYKEYISFENILNTKLICSNNIILKLRSKKDQNEINLIKNAVELTDKAYIELIKYLKSIDYTKKTEKDIQEKIRSLAIKNGGDGLGFDTIVASGKNSAEPHFKSSNAKLKRGQVLLLDLGVSYKGYTGDLSRCVYLGQADQHIKKIYNFVLECNEKCINYIKANQKFIDIHRKAESFFSTKDLNKFFIHSIGHGIGLNAHEYPVPNSSIDKLVNGMVFTIEPGLYFKNKYGIRIEDVIWLDRNQPKILSNQSTKKFLEI